MSLPRANPDGSVTLRSAPTGPLVTVAGAVTNFGAEAVLFVDPSNSTGNASNDNVGNDPMAPIATMQETARRLSRPTIIDQNVEVTVLSDGPSDDPFFYDIAVNAAGFPGSVNVRSFPSTLATVVLDGVTTQNSATNTYATITVGGFDFTPYVNSRYEVAVGASPGSIGWIVAVPGAVDTAIVTRPFNKTSFGSTNLAVGNTIDLQRLTKIGPVGGWSSTRNWVDFAINFWDLQSDSGDIYLFFQNSLAAFIGCDLISRWVNSADFCFYAASNVGRHPTIPFCEFYGTSEVNNCLLHNFEVRESANLVIIDESTHVGQMIVKGRVKSDNLLGFLDWGGGPAIDCRPEGSLDLIGRPWGLSATAGSYGFRQYSGSRTTYSTLPNIIGALSGGGQDVLIGGTPLAYAALPNVNAANLAAMVLRA